MTFYEFLDKFISKDVKHLILKKVWPLVRSIAHLFEDRAKQDIKQEDWFKLTSFLKTGDIILTVGKSPFSGVFIPGLVKHAAIVNSYHHPKVVEAISGGVVETNLYDFLKNKIIFYLVRPKFANNYVTERAAKEAEDRIGLPYDNIFSFDNDRVYCSELVYLAYKQACALMGKPFPLKTTVLFEEEMYLPDDIRTDTDSWEIIYTNDIRRHQ